MDTNNMCQASCESVSSEPCPYAVDGGLAWVLSEMEGHGVQCGSAWELVSVGQCVHGREGVCPTGPIDSNTFRGARVLTGVSLAYDPRSENEKPLSALARFFTRVGG
jgi:hypothetical protein